jgi:hypothetical protein
MAFFGLEDFKTEVFSKGLAENSKFEMIISPPRSINNVSSITNKVSMLCEISNFPPINLMVRTMNLYGPAHQRPVSIDFGGDGLAASFYLDREMNVKRFFDAWMAGVVNSTSFNVSYQGDYVAPIYIRQLSDGADLPIYSLYKPEGIEEQPTYSIVLEEAFPRSMNIVDLNMGAQNQISRLTVVFAYRKWSYDTSGGPSIYT